MSGKRNTVHLIERKCPVCGKTFFPFPEHVYKDARDKSRNVCSWSCTLKSERLKEEAAESRKVLRELMKVGGKA